MKFPDPYRSVRSKMTALERWILVHSIIYYRLSESIVSDHEYDSNEHQLMKLITKYPKQFKKTKYYEAFKDFDGNTGFDLFSKLSGEDQLDIRNTAEYVVYLYDKKHQY